MTQDAVNAVVGEFDPLSAPFDDPGFADLRSRCPVSRTGTGAWYLARYDDVEAALTAEKIGSRRFWYPIHRQDSYKRADDGFEAAIDASARGLWLPSHFSLTESEAERAAAVVRRVLAGRT